MTNQSKDTGYAPEKWEFDAQVTEVFDDMLDRSIPDYPQMRRLVASMGQNYAQDGIVLDIGSSLGDAIIPYLETARQIVGFDISSPMIKKAKQRFNYKEHNIQFRGGDISRGIGDFPQMGSVNLALSVLTMMFVPTDRRLYTVRDIYDHLAPGGAFIMVEKIIGETSQTDAMMVKEYYAMKQENGYSLDDIERKRLSLQGVLVPLTAHMNEDMLVRSGFSTVECFWRWMNFAAWIAIK